MTPFLPAKRLGQNFLVDENILNRIINACDLHDSDDVLEIGPGHGALTRALLPRVRKVIAVETDPKLSDELRQGLVPLGLRLHSADILSFDISSVISGPVKVIGNIPYNISTPIMEKMITDRRSIRSLYLTVQYEFGKRLTAATGSKDRSALTCLLDFFAIPKIQFRISNQAFRPIPKVESCFMRIDFRTSLLFPLKNEAFFIKVVKTAFLQRRKILLNALAPLASKEEVQRALVQAGIKEKTRPEDVKSQDYARISNILFKGLIHA